MSTPTFTPDPVATAGRRRQAHDLASQGLTTRQIAGWPPQSVVTARVAAPAEVVTVTERGPVEYRTAPGPTRTVTEMKTEHVHHHHEPEPTSSPSGGGE